MKNLSNSYLDLSNPTTSFVNKFSDSLFDILKLMIDFGVVRLEY